MNLDRKLPELKRWTVSAVYCYKRHCVCKGCLYKEILESECCMKETVLALYRKFGEPIEARLKRMERKQKRIIEYYGFEAQKEKLKEEMTELAYARDEENFIEEIADVLNVIQGIVAYKGWEKKIAEIQEQKLDRQIGRINNEIYKKKEVNNEC